MNGTRNSIEVRLPEGVEPTPDDLEALEVTCQAILALRHEGGTAWREVERALAADGWDVSTRLMWIAEARRGRESEQGVGRTKDEAYGRLRELTTIDDLSAVP